MRLKLLTAIMVGTIAASAVPAAAQNSLTPSGGERHDPASGGSYYEGQYLYIPGETRFVPWAQYSTRGGLTPSGGQGGHRNSVSGGGAY